jgi:hypothetical protein
MSETSVIVQIRSDTRQSKELSCQNVSKQEKEKKIECLLKEQNKCEKSNASFYNRVVEVLKKKIQV